MIALFAAQVEPFVKNNAMCTVLMFLGFGWAMIPFGYILSYLFAKEETANSNKTNLFAISLFLLFNKEILYSIFSIISVILYMIVSVIFGQTARDNTTIGTVLSILYPPQALTMSSTVLCETIIAPAQPLTFTTMFYFSNKFIIYILINFVQGIIFLLINMYHTFSISILTQKILTWKKID